jgi:hypothetical protein
LNIASTPRWRALWRNTHSAIGLRQMLPMHTINTLTDDCDMTSIIGLLQWKSRVHLAIDDISHPLRGTQTVHLVQEMVA